jgi:DNA (cytosine-5)-methyltransferase 1
MFQHDGERYVVRRLMPVECERLQAFPDGWTDLTGCDADEITERVSAALGYAEDGKERKALRRKVQKWSDGTSDTPRYKAMGNSFTTTVVELLGRRIQAWDELHYDEVGLGGKAPDKSPDGM